MVNFGVGVGNGWSQCGIGVDFCADDLLPHHLSDRPYWVIRRDFKIKVGLNGM